MQRITIWIILGSLGAASGVAHAQDRPFVFSVTTASDTTKPRLLVDYDLGVGEQTFQQGEANGPEQRIGLQASVGRFTLIGRVGVASAGESYRTSSQGEVLVSLLTRGETGLGVAVGGGVLQEAGGAQLLLTRIVAGRDTAATRLQGNLLFQKPLRADRDAFDLITTVGWALRVNPAWSVGVEAIGEDLEGFWDSAEAEGGARLLVGPSVHIAVPQRRWQLSVAGGPSFHPTTSGRTSDALRNLPPSSGARGFAVRTTFACRF